MDAQPRPHPLVRWLQNDWFVTLLFLLAYLCTNSYIFAWDDQHLEIPLLKRLIDPTLYPGDYYVDGLAKNFSSWLYPILAKLITTQQIPAVYLGLFLLSRYLMFFWIYRLWQFLGGGKWQAAMAVLMFFLLGRTEEFLYRTFSHQEFSYIFMFGGFYYFFRERFLLAAFWFGVGANFHAIYNLFPMLYMMAYLLLFQKERKLPLLLKAGGVFTLFALPFLLWQIPRSLAHGGQPVPTGEWLPLYLISCQQNFLFWTLPLKDALTNLTFVLIRLEPYLYLLVLYAGLCLVEPRLRQDKKTHTIVLVSYLLIGVSVYFSYIHPSRFILDLNLLRNEQFVRFMVMGYATVLSCRLAREGRLWQALLGALFLFLVGFGSVSFFLLKLKKYAYVPVLLVGITALAQWKPDWTWLRRLLIAVPLAASFVSFSMYHYSYVQAKQHGAGLWQMHRNWVDMQRYVRAHTPKNALIMAPYDTDTGGFRIFSERRLLVCYRDCGIIGFDYQAAREWHQKIQDITEFKMFTNQAIDRALVNGIFKYKVDYIVFMNYYQPKEANPLVRKMYQNEVFALYEVIH